MFLIHTRVSGRINHLSERYQGVVNGIYIAAYYLGGSLGSWLPAVMYRHGGWTVFLLVLGAALALSARYQHCFLTRSPAD